MALSPPRSLVESQGIMLAVHIQDLIKARIQVQRDDKPRAYRVRFFDGDLWIVGNKLCRTEGLHRPWKGFQPVQQGLFPANAAGFFAYELAVKASEQLVPLKYLMPLGG